MPQQLSLFGTPPDTSQDRLFFALQPGPAAATGIARLTADLRRELGIKGPVVAIERLHVTLHYIGDYAGLPRHIVASASAVLADLAAPAFEVAFDRVVTFGRHGSRLPLVLRGGDDDTALAALQQMLASAMARAGLRQRLGGRYPPHVTLLYGDRAVTERTVEPIRWVADEVVLVHSLVGRSRHVVLARRRLAAA